MSLSTKNLLFAQHGWNDDHRDMRQLVAMLAAPDTRAFSPNLGIFRTWLAIEPLIVAVEEQLNVAMTQHPTARLRIVGHSLGGLIWLELLDRRRELWPNVHSIVLLGSPVGGADLACIVDPFGLLPTIARDLGKNRRPIAEEIARAIPTLVIAGDSDGGGDNVITVGSTRVEGAVTLRLPGVWHNALRTPQAVAGHIQRFWGDRSESTIIKQLVQLLEAVPGMTDAHDRDFKHAKIMLTFPDETTLRLWKNPVGVDHVFVADSSGLLCFGGFVGWVHAADLQACIARIKRVFQATASSDMFSR